MTLTRNVENQDGFTHGGCEPYWISIRYITALFYIYACRIHLLNC